MVNIKMTYLSTTQIPILYFRKSIHLIVFCQDGCLLYSPGFSLPIWIIRHQIILFHSLGFSLLLLSCIGIHLILNMLCPIFPNMTMNILPFGFPCSRFRADRFVINSPHPHLHKISDFCFLPNKHATRILLEFHFSCYFLTIYCKE